MLQIIRMLSPPPTDKTLTQEGVAADAKAVGDALKAAELIVKSENYSETIGEYSQLAVRLPKDCKVLLNISCNNAIMWIQSIGNGAITFRCFGPTVDIQLGNMSGQRIAFTLYYL